MTKYLIGVDHANQEELDSLILELDGLKPISAGLELPINYQEQKLMGVIYAFFTPLEEYLASEDVHVSLLDNDKLKHEYGAVKTAKLSLQGRIPRKDLEQSLFVAKTFLEQNTTYMPPEFTRRFERDAAFYQRVLQILDDRLSIEEIQALINTANKNREQFMLERILQEQPQTVIIGDAHAETLKGELPDYKYLCRSKLK
ncbi:hypothetical protein COV11_04560 [Candidatus Woesearchaeota archaeon CG10_big_fil_rev_8_21_14_0_10_30_7]|nr:MAG: hypothetical protein COV11_04560 [Candidatus Woesearchaeota archaeon CG10_big_fil_rev_8_21_14_0_10_30_7]